MSNGLIKRLLSSVLVLGVLLTTAAIFGFAPSATAAPSAPSIRDQQWWLTTWRLPEVWKISKGAGVTVAVIDSGIDASLPELSGAVLPGTDLTESGGDGRVDHGKHGTSMGAMIAARGTGGAGMIGVAPEAKLLPVTIGDGMGALEALDQALRWSVDHGAKVINISRASVNALTSDVCPTLIQAAVRYAISKDAVVIAGAGNVPDGPAFFPAACPGVVSVGAIDVALRPWHMSHRDQYVDTAAPGVGMWTIAPGGGTRYTDGTSNATALISGLFALIRSKFPELSAKEAVTRALASARDLATPGRDDATGYGGFRPYQALTLDVPAGAANPIFDEYEAAPVPPEPSGSSGSPSVQPLAKSDGGAPSTGTVVAMIVGGILAVVLLLGVVTLVIVLIKRGKRS